MNHPGDRAPRQRRLRRAAQVGLGLVAALVVLVAWQHVAHRRSAAAAQRLLERGRSAFAAHCAVCHGERMEGHRLEDGTVVPPLDKPGFMVFFRLLPAAMEGWVREQIGAGNAVMPAFGQRLDGPTLDALAYYLWAVNTGNAAP